MPVSGTNKRESKSHPMCMFLANTEWSGDDARRAEISSLYPKTLATRPLSGIAFTGDCHSVTGKDFLLDQRTVITMDHSFLSYFASVAHFWAVLKAFSSSLPLDGNVDPQILFLP